MPPGQLFRDLRARLLPIDLQLFYCSLLCRVLTANNCFASVQFLSSRAAAALICNIQKEISRALWSSADTIHIVFDDVAFSLNLSILIGTQFAATDCQQQNLFCLHRSFVYETIFCLCAWISKESFATRRFDVPSMSLINFWICRQREKERWLRVIRCCALLIEVDFFLMWEESLVEEIETF